LNEKMPAEALMPGGHFFARITFAADFSFNPRRG
jgi:hypothetical protein